MYPMNTLSRLCPRFNINEIHLFINIRSFSPKIFRRNKTKQTNTPNFKPSNFKAKLKKKKKTAANPGKKLNIQVSGQT